MYLSCSVSILLFRAAESAWSKQDSVTYYFYYVDLQIAMEGDAGRFLFGCTLPSKL